jgi:[glutamine synthetase] adenylyltransferase / [glutamine synthetase]-adenylyl-L-tyrosine phosphorylase
MLGLLSEVHNAIPDDLVDPALFREPKRARLELEAIRACASDDLLRVLPPLLSESPDPDQALNLLARLAGINSGELMRTFDRNRVLLHHALLIFGHSYWLGETVLHCPDLLRALDGERNIERSLGREDYRESLARLRSRTVETDTSHLLALFKRRQYVRIALRDILGIATLAETAEEISALGDVVIEEALSKAESQMENRYGRLECRDSQGRLSPGRFAILALGKLGGNELNYSSDVDLLYLYGEGDSAGPLSVREYYIRQAQLLTEILSRVTPEGSAFRIDLRLRPQGHEGEPAIGLQHALNYYTHAAHDWELQALIKARYSAGDEMLAREFINGVERRVYTENLNFEAIETALHSREKMGAHRRRLMAVRRGAAAIDVKTDAGGIRDIEFLVQCLQRVYGGSERWLRSGGTLFSLQKLHDKGHLSGKDFHELTVTYEFLRRIEHRLQMQRGRQLHRLPESPHELETLHRAVGRGARDESLSAFMFTVQSRMSRVVEICDRVVRGERRRHQHPEAAQPEPGSAPAAGRPMSFEQVLQQASADSPPLGELVVQADVSLHARRALHRFLGSAMTSAERYAALLENPRLVAQALVLLESSEYLTDILVQHPDALRVLDHLSASEVGEADRNLSADEAEFFPGVESAPNPGEAMTALRRGYRARIFARGAQDILNPGPALSSMLVTTRLADAAIRSALRMAQGQDLLAVFGLGRLGTNEFDIASDADLLFVRDPSTPESSARAAAEKLVHILAAYTREGTLFAVDARLRPHGGEGELVVTPAQLEKYLGGEAQPWEALTYSKLRFAAGREDVASLTLPQVRRRIAEMSAGSDFTRQVLDMRGRLEKSNRYSNSFKLARGGFYDIDFLVCFLMLSHDLLCDGNTLERLKHLHAKRLFNTQVFAVLERATVLYRTADHVIRLVTGRARPELPQAEHARHATMSLVNRILGHDPGRDLQAELNATKERVRSIFTDLISE